MRSAIFDTESDGLLDTISVFHCAVILDLQTQDLQVFDPSNIDELCSALEQYDQLIGHNIIGHDFPCLRKIYNWEFQGEKVDTLLMSRTQSPNRKLDPKDKNYNNHGPHSIEAWAYRVGDDQKVQNEDWTTFTPLMLERCISDVGINEKVYYVLKEEEKQYGFENANRLNAKLFHYLQRQEEYGWLVDREHMELSIKRLDRWIDRITNIIGPRLPFVVEILEGKEDGEYKWVKKPFKKDGSLSKTGQQFISATQGDLVGPFSRVDFRSVNLDSNEEMKEYLLALGWEPKEWNEKDGVRTSAKLSKDDDFIGVKGGLGSLIVRRVKCRHSKSTLEGWLKSIRSDGRITPKVGGIANTGRLRHAGIVNVPNPTTKSFFAKQMRECFIAKSGWVLVGVDSKSNQVRQLAARMQDQRFTDIILDPTKDIHEENRKLGAAPTRTIAKNLYYGTIFGAGDAKIGKLVQGGAKAGKALKEQFFLNLPKLAETIENMRELWRKTAQKIWNSKFNRLEYRNGYITGLDGRPILVEYEKDVLCYYLQADESIHMAGAYCWAQKEIERRGYVHGKDFGFVIYYHDEVVAEAKPEIAKEIMDIMVESIKWSGEYFNIACPHEGTGKIGRTWADIH